MKAVRVGTAGVLALLLWVALAAWTFMSPVGAAPDDDYHLAMVYCAVGEAQCQVQGERAGPCFTMLPSVAADCSDWGSRSVPETDGIRADHYPPFYYRAMAPLVGSTLAETTIAMRLANVTLAVVMLVAAVTLSAPALRRAMMWSWAVAAVPMGVYFIASTNPSAWVIIGFAAVWGPLLTHLCAPRGTGAHWPSAETPAIRAARVTFILLASLIALAGRTEGALFLPLLVAALVVFALPRSASGFNLALLRRLLLPAVMVVLSGIFLLLFARPKAGAATAPADPGEQTFRGWEVVQHTVNSFLGTLGMPGVPGSGLGTYDVPVPALAAALTVGAFITASIWGLGTMYGRKAIAVTLLASTAVTVTAVLWSRVTWEYFQPRYFIPLTVAWLGLVLLPRPEGSIVAGDAPTPGSSAREPTAGTDSPHTPFIALPATLIAVAVSNSMAMLSTIQRFTRGVQPQPSRDPLTPQAPAVNPGELADSSDPLWWWNSLPLTPFEVWLIGSLAFGAVVGGVWWLTRHPTMASPPPDTSRARSELPVAPSSAL